jgi:hypothetical protein
MYDTQKLKITLYMSLKHTYAALITSICNDFGSYYNNKDIGELLDFDTFLLLLKSDSLDVISEDHILEAVINWYVLF